MFKFNWLLILTAIGGLIILGALAHGKINEPDCDDILVKLPISQELPPEQRIADQTNSVTCEADCQVSFAGRGQADIPANTKHNAANAHCDRAEEFDLLAQERMAHWTGYIAGFTGIGLILLGLTFSEAYAATSAAKKAADASSAANDTTRELFVEEKRPWLECHFVQTSDGVLYAFNDFSLLGKLKFKNIGHTPAKNIHCHTLELVDRIDESVERDLKAMIEKAKASEAKVGQSALPNGSAAFPTELTLKDIGNVYQGRITHLVGFVEYMYAGSVKKHITPFAWTFGGGLNDMNDPNSFYRSTFEQTPINVEPD